MAGCHDVTPNPMNTSGSVNKVWMRKVRLHDHVTTHQGLQLGGWGDSGKGGEKWLPTWVRGLTGRW